MTKETTYVIIVRSQDLTLINATQYQMTINLPEVANATKFSIGIKDAFVVRTGTVNDDVFSICSNTLKYKCNYDSKYLSIGNSNVLAQMHAQYPYISAAQVFLDTNNINGTHSFWLEGLSGKLVPGTGYTSFVFSLVVMATF